MRQSAIIARYTLLEALRARLVHTLVAGLAAAALAALFAAGLAITEADRLRVVLFAATLRAGVVLLVAMHVISTLARDFSDRTYDTLLALEMTRSAWIAGRLAGYALLSALAAAAAFAALLALAPPGAALAWSVSLALETTLVAAAAVFFLVTFGSPAAAAVFVAGFYVLARSTDALRLIGGAAQAEAASGGWRTLTDGAVEALALFLPTLARWTESAWLADGLPAPSVLALLAVQAAGYTALLAAAAMFDFRRAEL